MTHSLLKPVLKHWVPYSIGFLVFLLFCPTVGFDFVGYDDRIGIVENLSVRKLDLFEIFSSRNNNLYSPLTILTFALEHRLLGLNSTLFHLDNILLHITNTILLYFLFIRYFNLTMGASAIAALVFGIHPMHVESVTWITERKDVLCVLLFLSAFHFYAKYVAKYVSGVPFYFLVYFLVYFLALLLFALGLLAKPMGLTFPVVAILYDLYVGRKLSYRIIFEKIPFFAFSCISALNSLGYIGAFPFEKPPVPFWDRVYSAVNSIFFYLSRFPFPRHLSVLYEGPLAWVQDSDVAIAASLLLAFTLSFYKFPKIRKEMLFGLGFFLVTFSVISQFFPMGPGTFQDHYLYLPGIGLILCTVKSGEALFQAIETAPSLRRGFLATVGIALLCLAIQTWQQNQIWRNQETLSLNTLKYNPNSAHAHYDLGTYYARNKQWNKAIEHLQKTLDLGQGEKLTYTNLGYCYSHLEKHQEAIAAYEMAIKLAPNDVTPLNNLGFEYLLLDLLDKAEPLFKKVLEMNPKYAITYRNLGLLNLKRNNPIEAFRHYQKGLQIDPFLELNPSESAFLNEMRK